MIETAKRTNTWVLNFSERTVGQGFAAIWDMTNHTREVWRPSKTLNVMLTNEKQKDAGEWSDSVHFEG
jgi:hypothetical protein